MTPGQKSLLWLGGGVLALAAVMWLAVGNIAGHSEIKDLVHVESPDHRYLATGYHVLGGATVADMTVVVLHRKGQDYRDRANPAVLVADNLEPFALHWLSDRELAVRCSLERAYTKSSLWNDVVVRYSTAAGQE